MKSSFFCGAEFPAPTSAISLSIFISQPCFISVPKLSLTIQHFLCPMLSFLPKFLVVYAKAVLRAYWGSLRSNQKYFGLCHLCLPSKSFHYRQRFFAIPQTPPNLFRSVGWSCPSCGQDSIGKTKFFE